MFYSLLNHTRTIVFAGCALLAHTTMAQKQTKEQIVSDLIKKMTVEEKVGQMTNLTLAAIAEPKDNPIKLDMNKVREMIVKNNIGSIQNVISHAYTIEEWHQIINTLQKVTLEETRMKIPFLYCIDAVHGTNFTMGSTLFPHNLALAATRNPELVKQCNQITAKEVRASGIRYNFSPVLDVGRQPLWPRFPETFGEDVYLTTVMGVASIQGLEGTSLRDNTSVASCMKHFVGYSAPAVGKDRAPAYIPEIMLREYYLPSFKAAVDAGSHTLMVNSADVNGTPVHASKFLLTDVLRGELKYNGIIISDWMDILKLHERHRVASSHKEAVYLSVTAGIDMCIVPFDLSFYNDLVELVKEGRISEERINASVRRILDMKYDLGLFETPYVEKKVAKNFGLPEYKQTALQAAREAVTLLKNENNILPLKKASNFLVYGSQAESISDLNGAWSYTWQGQVADYFAKDEKTIAGAILANDARNHVTFFDEIEEVRKNPIHHHLDYIIVCLGENAYAETPGNIKELDLPLQQQKDVQELVAKYPGVPVIYILVEGRPRVIREIEPLAQAILMAYWPGSQGAHAISDILFGDFNPCGKLPFTYPRYSGELLTYDHKPLDVAVEIVYPEYNYFYSFEPQWEFGHGLSYTTFEYSNLKVSSSTLTGNDKITVSVDVKNTGAKAGKEVVELYSRDEYASVVPSVKRLRKFTKIDLAPGQTQTVTFELLASDLAFVGTDMKWITEPGDFTLMIKNLQTKISYK
ncbi:MAG: glycoside hydrolase family 3 N-terminal domain-containing protein [Cytophagaceae bacterium]